LIGVVALAGCSAGVIDAVDLAPGALFEGLIAHWTFDDGAGMTATDVAGSSQNGMISGATMWLQGEHFGGALRLLGGDSEIQVPMFTQPNASWSVAGWIRAPIQDTSDGYATIMSTEIPQTATGLPAGGWELNLRIGMPSNPANPISLYQYAYWKGPLDNAYSFQECKCFVENEWTHIAGVLDLDRQTISIYHNGSLVGSDGPAPKIRPGTDTLYFGRWGFDDTSRHLIGDLDDFVVYNRALTPPEIRLLASAPLPVAPPP